MIRPLLLLFLLVVPALAVRAQSPSVVELFEDDTGTLIPQLTMGGLGGGEDVKAAAEKDDVFTGKTALRVGAMQRFNSAIKDWDYQIAEKPKDGEYRYLRFAWKKLGDGPIMIQFHTRRPTADWVIRYYMGPEPPPWPSKVLAQEAPADWQLVTCDLFKDFGTVSLSGIAFTPYACGDGLFDHILLGRSIADLDKATAAAILKTPARPLGEAQLRQLWNQLGSAADIVGSTALWALVAGRKDAVPFIAKTVVVPNRKEPLLVDEAKVAPLLEQLTHYRHLTREAAAEELSRLGDGVIPHLRKAADRADGLAKDRLQALLDRWSARAGQDGIRLRRCAIALRTINVPETRELLGRIEKALGADQ
jgi:hypothetical protein